MDITIGGTCTIKGSTSNTIQEMIEIYDAGTQSVSASSDVQLELDTVRWGTSSMHDSANNRVQVSTSGIYLVIGRGAPNPDSNTGTINQLIVIRKNSGGTEQERWYEGDQPSDNAIFYYECTHIFKADTDDYFELWVYHDASSSITYGHASNEHQQSGLTVIRLARI
jgi:hypothetical protein